MPIGTNLDTTERMRLMDRLDILLGGWPQDAPDMYQLASPITHVHPGCPPTLLIQGNQDIFCPVDATCAHYAKLVESGVPAINLAFPRTNHGFDLLFPHVSPPACRYATRLLLSCGSQTHTIKLCSTTVVEIHKCENV